MLQTAEGQPVYAETAAQPYPEIYVELDGCQRILITDADYQDTSERQWFLGGQTGVDRCTTGTHQSSTSYEAVGDWCTAVTGNLNEPRPGNINYDGHYAR